MLWSVRVVLAGKGSNMYDLWLKDHVCIRKETGSQTRGWLCRKERDEHMHAFGLVVHVPDPDIIS